MKIGYEILFKREAQVYKTRLKSPQWSVIFEVSLFEDTRTSVSYLYFYFFKADLTSPH